MPMSNLYPTTDWKPSEVIDDGIYELSLEPKLPPGEYSLEIGLYSLGTGQRLDVLDQMGNPQDTRVRVSGIDIGEP